MEMVAGLPLRGHLPRASNGDAGALATMDDPERRRHRIPRPCVHTCEAGGAYRLHIEPQVRRVRRDLASLPTFDATFLLILLLLLGWRGLIMLFSVGMR